MRSTGSRPRSTAARGRARDVRAVRRSRVMRSRGIHDGLGASQLSARGDPGCLIGCSRHWCSPPAAAASGSNPPAPPRPVIPLREAKLLPPVVVVSADQAYPETVARPLFTPRPCVPRPRRRAAETNGSSRRAEPVLQGADRRSGSQAHRPCCARNPAARSTGVERRRRREWHQGERDRSRDRHAHHGTRIAKSFRARPQGRQVQWLLRLCQLRRDPSGHPCAERPGAPGTPPPGTLTPPAPVPGQYVRGARRSAGPSRPIPEEAADPGAINPSGRHAPLTPRSCSRRRARSGTHSRRGPAHEIQKSNRREVSSS